MSRGALVGWSLALLLAAPQAWGHPAGVPRTTAKEAPRAPVIDGRFDELAWKGAAWATGFTERKPILHAKPRDKTSFAVIYDADAVYIAVRMLDTQPDKILARTLAKDSFNLFRDDAISIKLDAHHDHRTTFGFVVNPGSGNLDYKGVNEARFERGVDMVWSAVSLRTPEGWNAEFRIPWSSLGIDPASPPPVMGLNLSRDHPRRNATYDWSLMEPPFSAISASRYGEVVGFKPAKGASASWDWSVLPYVLGGFRRDYVQDTDTVLTKEVFNAGIDGQVSLGQRFGMQLSVNTDFAQVDLDDQVVNLTRFGLFFEEKRDFFLADLELYEFGRPGSAQLLYTRRIGLASEGAAQVPLMTGLKLAGRPLQNVRVGLLHVTTRPLTAENLPWEQHLAARLQIEADDGSTGGFMATWRQSMDTIGDHNLVLGVDGTWRGGGTPFLANAFAVMSLTGADARFGGSATGERRKGEAGTPAAAVGVDLTYRDLFLRPTLSYAYYASEFRSDMGFYQRVGGHEPGIGFDWVPRFNRGGIEKLEMEFELDAWVWEGADSEGVTGRFDWSAELDATLVWEEGWSLGIETGVGRAAVLDAFNLGATAEIPVGDYLESELSLVARTPGQYIVSASFKATRSDFFGGELYGADLGLVVNPSPLFRLDLDAGYDRAMFPDPSKDFDAATLNARITMGFTPELVASFYTGWNYLADRLRVQARLRWAYLPGSDLFIVYQLDSQPDPFQELFQSLLVKLTFHYPWDD